MMARQKLRDSEDSLLVKGGLLEQNLPDVKPVLDEAHEHALELQRTAENLERLLDYNFEKPKRGSHLRKSPAFFF